MHKKPKNMHKIDYEKLISIKRDVGWFEKKGDSIRGHNGQGYILVCRKKAQRRIGSRKHVPSCEILISRICQFLFIPFC